MGFTTLKPSQTHIYISQALKRPKTRPIMVEPLADKASVSRFMGPVRHPKTSRRSPAP